MKLTHVATAAFLVSGLLSGCSMQTTLLKSRSDYDQAHVKAISAVEATNAPQAAPSLVTVQDYPWVEPHPVPYVDHYPAKFQNAVNFNSRPGPVDALMRSLAATSGYSVTAANEVAEIPATANSAGGNADAPGVAFNGTFEDLLNLVGSKLNATWSFDRDSGTIRFFRYETKVFQIATVPGTTVNDSTFSDSQSSVTGGQGQAVHANGGIGKTGFVTSVGIWKTISDNIKPMLSPRGVLALSEPTSTITVHDVWTNVDEVAQYVKTLNRSLTMQVRVNVSVYEVQENRGDERAFNWSVLYNTIAKRAGSLGFTINTPPSTSAGLGELTLSSPTTNSRGSTVPFAGSQAFMQMLDSVGKTSIVSEGGIVTVNNVPAPFRSFDSQGYLAESTSLYSAGSVVGGGAVGAGATLTPGTVNTGFSMSALPSVQPDGHRVLLQMNITLSTLQSLLPVASGGEMIQVPHVIGDQLMPQAWLHSGETLILADFQTTKSSQVSSSPIDAHAWMIAGDRNVQHNRSVIVICITPVVTSQDNAI